MCIVYALKIMNNPLMYYYCILLATFLVVYQLSTHLLLFCTKLDYLLGDIFLLLDPSFHRCFSFIGFLIQKSEFPVLINFLLHYNTQTHAY